MPPVYPTRECYTRGMTDQKKHYTNREIHEMLALIAAIYQLQNKNRFQIIAYQKAAESVEMLQQELYSIWHEGKLKEVPGFGSSIGKSIEELFSTGHAPHFEEVIAQVPPSLPVLMKVPGIGPKKAYRLIMEFELFDPKTVLPEVVRVANEGRIAPMDKFGEKSQYDIKAAVELYMATGAGDGRMPYPIAADIFEKVKAHIMQLPYIKRIDAMGSLRRGRETIGDVDVSVMADDEHSKAIIEHFLAIPGKLAIDNAGDAKASIIFPPNVRIDLRTQNEKQYGSMLQYFTGSKQHNVNLREYALKQDYSLNEYGIKDTKTGELHLFSNEEDFYGFLGLAYVPPELREGTTEIKQAKDRTLPQLVTVEDIKGDFHMHAQYDLKTSHDIGKNTYRELVDKCVERGYKYLGFADHNPRQSGLSEQEITEIMHKRYEDIHNSLKDAPVPFYIGLEVDILPNGSLALPESAVPYVDYLIVSLHSAFTKSREEQTERILKALSYPKVRIFGHPTGRLLNKREGVTANWDQIYSYAAEHDIALEINASPMRLDLPDSMVREAAAQGVKFCIDTDAHAADQLDGMPYGVTVARRGWLEPAQVVNTWEPESFKKWLLQQ